MAAAGRGASSRLRLRSGQEPEPDVADAAPALPGALVLPPPGSLAARLYSAGYQFNFFQAVRLLEDISPQRQPVGQTGSPFTEVARFRTLLSLSFPASQIYTVETPTLSLPPVVTVAFMGLTGPTGILPRHYTELLLRLQKEAKGPEKTALRDWLDLFNHRLISLFYRAWEKYRFYIPYRRKEHARAEPDTFTRGLFSMMGMGMPSLRNRLRVSQWETDEGPGRERVLARIDDLSLIWYGGLLSQRPRSAMGLKALLEDYFGMAVEVRQFHGQWLQLPPGSQTALGNLEHNNGLGTTAVAGERVWDVVGRIRLRLGPLDYGLFNEFIPDRSPTPRRKAFFLLVHLARLYMGLELSFDVQVVLKASAVPECCLEEGEDAGPRLGWNTWMRSHEAETDADDAVFEGEEIVWVNQGPSPSERRI